MGLGYKAFTATVLTAADVNGYLMKQSVMRFASTAARDAAITAPEDGMVAYVGSNDSNEGLYVYNGTNWRKGPGWNAPWGHVAEIVQATDSAALATNTWGAYLTWSGTGLPANRLYRARVNFYWVASLVGQLDFGIGAVNGTPTRNFAQYNFANTAPNQSGQELTFTTTAGSMTRLLTIRMTTGGGTVVLKAGSALIIEDMGPNGAPT